jgi:ATP-dependent RNA helicase DbpA
LLSPTGTGKTLAFLLSLLKTLDADSKEVQALIIVPTRELAIHSTC